MKLQNRTTPLLAFVVTLVNVCDIIGIEAIVENGYNMYVEDHGERSLRLTYLIEYRYITYTCSISLPSL